MKITAKLYYICLTFVQLGPEIIKDRITPGVQMKYGDKYK